MVSLDGVPWWMRRQQRVGFLRLDTAIVERAQLRGDAGCRRQDMNRADGSGRAKVDLLVDVMAAESVDDVRVS